MLGKLISRAGHFYLRMTTLIVAMAMMVMAVPAVNAQSAMTRFDPRTHGFQFNNTFKNIVVNDIHSGGLCGGMVYAALDYYYDRSRTLPDQFYPPKEGDRLRSYMYDKTTEAIVKNLDMWAGVGFNPFGSRNGELFGTGIDANNGQWRRLRQWIDRGRPIPIGLQSCDGPGCKGNHVMLAIGYRIGKRPGDLEIKVYDPNNSRRTLTLVPDRKLKQFKLRELEGTRRESRWQAWFVQTSYKASKPPSVRIPDYPNDGRARALVFQFMTGEDDLRGGSDNVSINMRDWNGKNYSVRNANRSKRWISFTDQWVRMEIPAGFDPANFRDVRLTTSFGGGLGGDNWDLAYFRIYAVGDDKNGKTFKRHVKTSWPIKRGRRPYKLYRFKGDRRELVKVINAKKPNLQGINERRLHLKEESSSFDKGYERISRPYKRFRVPMNGQATGCRRSCINDKICKSWTYGPRNICSLSSSVGQKLRNANRTSGIKHKYTELK